MKFLKPILILSVPILFAALVTVKRNGESKSVLQTPKANVEMRIYDASGRKLNWFFEGISPNTKIAATVAAGPMLKVGCNPVQKRLSSILSSLGIYTTALAQSYECTGGCPCNGCNQVPASNSCGLACDGGSNHDTYYDSMTTCTGAYVAGPNCFG